MTKGSSRGDIKAAFFLMLVPAFGFSLMSVIIKHLSATFPASQIVCLRSAFHFVLLILWMAAWRESTRVSRGASPRLLIQRGVLGLGGLLGQIYALSHLPLSVAAIFPYLAPLFVFLLSRVFLGEKVHPSAYLWVGVAILGLSFLLKLDVATLQFDLPVVPIIAGIFGAFCMGSTYVTIRAATQKHSPNLIVLYFTGISFAATTPFAVQQWYAPTSLEWAAFLVTGLLAGLAQMGMTNAYRVAAAPIVSVMGLMGTILGVTWGVVFFDESLRSSQFFGAALLLAAISMIVLRENIRASGRTVRT